MADEQTMKSETAARKLGVLLSATPEDFRSGSITRSRLAALQSDPPAWLADLRRDGPHPRPVVAARLGVSVAGLRRAEVLDPLTSEQIRGLLQDQPEWLVRERRVHAGVMAENARIKRDRAGA